MEFYAIPIETSQQDEEIFILFRPLLGIAFLGNQAMVTITQKFLSNNLIPEELNTHKSINSFLNSIGYLQEDPPPPLLPPANQFTPTHSVLLMTNRCQMRCIYCYASGGELQPEDLSVETGKTAIDIVHKNAVRQGRSQFNLSFHGGGEPIMAWQTIKELTEYARKKRIPAHINLTSNGVWTPVQKDWIIRNIDSISLSMDGHPDIQNYNRPLADGSKSSNVVMDSLRELDKVQKNYTIRMTAIAPWENLPKNIEFLASIIHHCRGIQVEPAFNSERGHHALPDQVQAKAFCTAFLEAFQIATTHRLNLRYSGARLRRPVASFCTAPYNTLIVNPKNQLVACYEITSEDHDLFPVSKLGYLDKDKLSLNLQTRQNLLQHIEEKRKTCHSCFCYWYCAGDCYSRTSSLINGETIDLHSRCSINQTLTKELLLQKIEQGNGVARLF